MIWSSKSPSRVAGSSTSSEAMTVEYTTTTVILCYAPRLTYDKSPMRIGETRRIHVENPETGRVSSASLSGASCCEWYFDEESSDIVITARSSCSDQAAMIYAQKCAFGGQIFLTVLDEEMTGVSTTAVTSTTNTTSHTETTATTDATESPKSTTTTVVTTVTGAADPTEPTEDPMQYIGYDWAPVLTYDKSPLAPNETRRIHVAPPRLFQGGIKSAVLITVPQ